MISNYKNYQRPSMKTKNEILYGMKMDLIININDIS